MRFPILIAVAVIVLTPANLREVTADMFFEAQATVWHWLGGTDRADVATVETGATASAPQN